MGSDRVLFIVMATWFGCRRCYFLAEQDTAGTGDPGNGARHRPEGWGARGRQLRGTGAARFRSLGSKNVLRLSCRLEWMEA